MRGLTWRRHLVIGAIVASVAGAALGAGIDSTAPRRVATFTHASMGAGSYDTLVISNFNYIALDWTPGVAAPLLIWSGLGIGNATNASTDTRDTLTSAVLTSLNAAGWRFRAWDIDTLIIGATAAFSYSAEASNW